MFDAGKLKDLKRLRKTETLLVGFDFDETNKDECILVVGQKRVNRDAVQILNAIHGAEAKEIFNKLIGKTEEK